MLYNEDEESKENSEVRSDILWRQTRDTVVPRLMTLDLKSERGALWRLGHLYPDKTPAHQPAAAFGGLGGIAEDIRGRRRMGQRRSLLLLRASRRAPVRAASSRH